ncbi:MAG TPA: aspartate aminotransferase family protein [Vicinamibacterales bacterium]|nr:aspartate aminotransferase family protein [Vicinamibacterales bacterium]
MNRSPRPDPTQPFAVAAHEIAKQELLRYMERTPASERAMARAERVLPLGVASSFQFYEPHPLVMRSASAAHMEDVDGHRYIDFTMGYGSLLTGHSHPAVRRAVEEQLARGTLFVSPSEDNAIVAELLAARFGLPQWRFTNSGTEATMDAIRVARCVTGRTRIVKVEGGYHGHHDSVLVSIKPALDTAGPVSAPRSIAATGGLPPGVVADTVVVPFNDPEALARVLEPGDVACFIVEPVMENIGICLPDPGYLQAVRDITRSHGTLLIFDEVKTGITAGWHGAGQRYGVTPDLLTVGKSIGGGLPLGAFGGSEECMDAITTGRVIHVGTFNGNPLCMAAAHAVLDEICTPEETGRVIARNQRFLADYQAALSRHAMPAHTVQCGAKGCITWSSTPVRNYRDYSATNFDLAFAQWIWGVNRGLLLPPGLDEQWLLSVAHTEADLASALDVFTSFLDAVADPTKIGAAYA